MLLEHLIGKRSSPENPATSLLNPAKWLLDWVGGGRSAAGVNITEENSLGIATVYSCVRVLAETIASLPLHVYRRAGKFREVAVDHPFATVLQEAPNPLQTPFSWREMLIAHAALWGNHYSLIELFNDGKMALIPVMPWNVKVEMTRDGRRKRYLVRMSDGTDREVREDRMLHIPALSYDGITGISPVRKLRNALGLAVAAETFGSKFFANDARPGVILETPGRLKEAATKTLAESLREKFTGVDNAWKVLVLEEGAKMHMVQMPMDDAQFLETRKFQRSEICGIFRVPPHMVADLERATFSNIEQQDINFAKHTILPWCVRIEHELRRKLFAGSEYVAKFNLEGLMRGDFKSRMEGYQVGVTNGIYLRNEVRELEDLPPVSGGDTALMPANLTTFDKLSAPATAGSK